jgi:hypothetical protein
LVAGEPAQAQNELALVEESFALLEEMNPFTYSLTYIALLCIYSGVKIDKGIGSSIHHPFVLSILSEGDNYGYAIIQRVKELSGGKIEWTEWHALSGSALARRPRFSE